MSKLGEYAEFKCLNCSTPLRGLWFYDERGVLYVKVWCRKCCIHQILYDCATLDSHLNYKIVQETCDSLERVTGWMAFSESMRNSLKKSLDDMCSDWEKAEEFLRLYAKEHPRKLLLFYWGIQKNALFNNENDTPNQHCQVDLYATISLYGPLIIPLCCVETQDLYERINRDNTTDFLGVDLEEHIVPVFIEPMGSLTEEKMEEAVRRLLKEIEPDLETLPIELYNLQN